MREQTIPAGDSPELVISSVAGNLSLNSWENMEIQARTDSDGLRLEEIGVQVQLECDSNCTVYAPVNAAITVEAVHGNARLAKFTGRLNVDSVHGNLQVQGAGAATVGSVHGNLSARNIQGVLTASRVAGNLQLTDVDGEVAARADGNISLAAINGNVHVDAKGDVDANLDPAAGGEYRLTAHGDINCYLPPDANADIVVRSAQDIAIRGLQAPVTHALGTYEFTLGSGDAEIILEAGGDVLLSGEGAAWHPFGAGMGFSVEMDAQTRRDLAEQAARAVQQATEQMTIQMDALAHQLEARLSELGSSEDLAARIHEKVSRALQKAEEKISKALSDAERRARAAEERAARSEERQRRRGPMGPAPTRPPGPVPATPKRALVSDEERMQILRMVESGKLSIEQAEQLLKALNG